MRVQLFYDHIGVISKKPVYVRFAEEDFVRVVHRFRAGKRWATSLIAMSFMIV